MPIVTEFEVVAFETLPVVGAEKARNDNQPVSVAGQSLMVFVFSGTGNRNAIHSDFISLPALLLYSRSDPGTGVKADTGRKP